MFLKRISIILGVLIAGTLMTFLMLGFFATPVTAEAQTQSIVNNLEAPAAANTLPILEDFEAGLTWFDYGDWGGGAAITKTLLLTDSLATLGAVSNTVMLVEYNSAGWGLGVGKDTVPFQDWSGYDGFSFWFYGENSGTMFDLILTDDAGERQATMFTDDFTGWQELRFPWPVFSRSLGYQPPGAPDDGLTLTAVEAFAFAPVSGSSGTFFIDQIKLYQDTAAVADDFEAGLTWFDYGDWGGGAAITKTLLLTDSLATLGAVSNTVMLVEYNSAGWGLGVGKDTVPFQDWSGYDGFSFWFYGENSGTAFDLILTDDAGERQATMFTDDFTGWQELRFPWQVFYRSPGYQPPGAPDDGLTLTAVEAFAFAPVAPSSGAFYLDRVRLYQDTAAVADDFEAGLTWFDYGDWGGGAAITKTLLLTDSLATLGAVSNTVMLVEYNSAGWGLGLGKDTVPFQDWSGYDGFSFWFYGENSGTMFDLILTDDAGERQTTMFTDDFTGWQELRFPWQVFSRSLGYQPPGAPDDGLTLTAVEAFAFAPVAPSSGAFYLDRVRLYRDNLDQALAVQFSDRDYAVTEGNLATITVTLNMTSSYPVTVTYATTDDTAIAGEDYIATSGEVTFTSGITQQTFTVQTLGNDVYEGNRSLLLALSDPVSVTLGSPAEATLTIEDDDPSNACEVRSTTVDDFEDGELPFGLDGDGNDIGFFTWSDGSPVAITTTLLATNTVLQMDSDISGWGGMTHHFENTAIDTWMPQDWSSYAAVSFWVYGTNSGSTVFFEVQDNRNPGSTADDTEVFSYPFVDDFSGWQRFEVMFTDFTRKDVGNGAPNDGFTLSEVHGWAFGTLPFSGTLYLDDVQICGYGAPPELAVSLDQSEFEVVETDTALITVSLNITATHPVTVSYRTAESYATPDRDYTPVSGTLVIAPGETTATFEVPTLPDNKFEGDENLMLVLSDALSATLGFQYRAALNILDDDLEDPALVHDFEGYHSFLDVSGNLTFTIHELMDTDPLARPEQDAYEHVLGVDFDTVSSSAQFTETFVQAQDWSAYEGLSFWYYGSGSGETITVDLLDNQITTTANLSPTEWVMVWNDEFEGATGTPPDPNVWRHEIGDGTLNSNPGWGNSESQFYTDSTDNAALDGNGNLAITMQKVDTENSDLACWYGPCEYTSARLITWDRMEYEYGRIESRILVPDGEDGLWPAFWALGTDIGDVGWPQSGEIDIMEYVSRLPNEVFGTLHGPGYSGGQGFGNIHTFAEPVANNYHTFVLEWGPDTIDWYVDDIHYHSAVPANVAPNEWVYNHPFFLILNMAIGGNFGGPIDPGIVFPQEMLVDYVRVYQADNTSERFEASFVDDFTGWQQVTLPFEDFTRSAEQPDGAPDDGLTLTEVWGYGMQMPEGTSGSFYMDWVYLEIDLPDYLIYLPLIYTE